MLLDFSSSVHIFQGDSSKSKATSAEDMDIDEAIKELAYLRSIQTGDNALPQEEEEFFRKLNDLSNASVAAGSILTKQKEKSIVEKFIEGRKNAQDVKGSSKNWKSLSENLGQSENKWEKMIDSMVGGTSGMEAKTELQEDDKKTYGPPLPPKKPASVTKKKGSHSSERPSRERTNRERSSRERSSSRGRSDKIEHFITQAIRGVRGGRGYRGRGFRGGYRGRGRGRGVFDPTRGRGRGIRGFRARGVRGGRGFFPTRGRHIFPSRSSGRRSRSRSSSSSSSSYSSRSRSSSRSHSRSRGRIRTKHRRRRSSSRSSYSSSSRSRSCSRNRGKGKRQSRCREQKL